MGLIREFVKDTLFWLMTSPRPRLFMQLTPADVIEEKLEIALTRATAEALGISEFDVNEKVIRRMARKWYTLVHPDYLAKLLSKAKP